MPRGVRTRNPSKRSAADPRLTPRGHGFGFKCTQCYTSLRFEILKASTLNFAVFWYVTLCSLVKTYRRFGEISDLRRQRWQNSRDVSDERRGPGSEQIPWWWRQQVSVKRRYTSTGRYGINSQKTVTFNVPAFQFRNL